ncbi:response regulator transcription factor [Ralstonia mannitolilytica]|uniref:response regulator transcription factor n=1 Tax=Ralstonia mannitolilytica TaxID=105219 RepID=UPI000CEF0699|nr:response regulator transcription factor [Ralstonia mannitolilytica]MBU9579485.1 response regulator transcription factor [Ralstonia mannitolilytica]
MHIALVHSASNDGDWVESTLRHLGHEVVRLTTLEALVSTLHQASYDLVVLHDAADHADILEALAFLRSRALQTVPALIYGSKPDQLAIARLLDGGADDYVEMPTGALAFSARVTALLRRVYPARMHQASFTVGAFDVVPSRRMVRVHGVPADLTEIETRLALLLFTNIDRTLSRSQIFALAWGRTAPLMTRTIDTHVSRLRTKLGLYEDNGVVLRGVYNVGYRLERYLVQSGEEFVPALPYALRA